MQKEKYVFFVQSNITKYLVKYYINLHCLSEEQVIIFYYRLRLSDIIELPGEKIDFLEKFQTKFLPNGEGAWKDFKVIWKAKNKIDHFINERINDGFVLFIHHLNWDNLQLFATNKKCKKIVYIEEGDLSYATEEEITQNFAKPNIKNEWRRKILSLGRLFRRHPFPNIDKVQEGICLNEKAFPYSYINKHVYSFKDVFFNESYSFKFNYENSIIFLLEHLHWKTQEERKEYLQELEKVFSSVKNNYKEKIYFKPHPELFNYREDLEQILGIAKVCKLEPDLMNDPIELVVSSFEHVKIFCNQSSLIRYCCYAQARPNVWGINMVKDEHRRKDPFLYKFIEENKALIKFI
ncbi:MAG: hypothetical protein ACO1OF_20255 [Adhaeribacter sp.]